MEEKERVDLANGQSVSVETILKLDDSFNIAMLLGRAIMATAYQLSPSDDIRPSSEDGSSAAGGVALENGRLIFPADEYETKIENQMRQLKALFMPEMQALLRPSALFDMLLFGASLFGMNSDSFEANYEKSSANKIKAAVAWIVAKRVFSIRHPDESIKIVNLTEPLLRESANLSFEPFNDTDRDFITEVCNSVSFSDGSSDTSLKQTFEKLNQLKASGSTILPLSKAFWKQPEIALKGRSVKNGTPLDVFGDGSKPARIIVSDLSGGPVEINAFDMSIEAACGQMWQENNNSQFTASAATIYRKCAGLDSGAAVSQNAIEKTVESILKLAKSWVYINYDVQLKKFLDSHKKKADKAEGFNYKVKVMDGNMLSIRRNSDLVVAPNGRIVSGNAIFTITSMPIIYEYSYGFKQLMKVDNKYIGEALTKATPENIPFARYIQTQLNAMRSCKKDNGSYNPTLTFEKIALCSTYDISNRAKLRNFQKKVMDYAQNLVSMGQIKAAHQHYSGKKYTGIDFIL